MYIMQYIIRNFSSLNRPKIINITSNAWKKIETIMHKSNNTQMLFSVKGGGCNGFNYNLNLIDKNNIPENLKKFNYVNNDKYKVYIDPLSEIYLIDTTIDYLNEDFEKNIYESKFVYIRDKSDVSTCGCGISFLPKNLN